MTKALGKFSRRGLLVSGGLALAAPALARPIGLVKMQGDSFSLDGFSKLNAMARWDRTIGLPGVRLVFSNGTTTAWHTYDRQCVAGTMRGASAVRIEVCTWAPNGMRAITEIPYDIGLLPQRSEPPAALSISEFF